MPRAHCLPPVPAHLQLWHCRAGTVILLYQADFRSTPFGHTVSRWRKRQSSTVGRGRKFSKPMEEKICGCTLSFTMVVTSSPTAKHVQALVRRTFIPWCLSWLGTVMMTPRGCWWLHCPVSDTGLAQLPHSRGGRAAMASMVPFPL